MKPTIYYKCDPEKNKECIKTRCYFMKVYKGCCRSTSNPDYAVLDESGKPIVNFVTFDKETRQAVNGGDA